MDAVLVRRWDDHAKSKGKKTPELEDFIRSVVVTAQAAVGARAPAAKL
jgi:predicted HD phosphohydrolase